MTTKRKSVKSKTNEMKKKTVDPNGRRSSFLAETVEEWVAVNHLLLGSCHKRLVDCQVFTPPIVGDEGVQKQEHGIGDTLDVMG